MSILENSWTKFYFWVKIVMFWDMKWGFIFRLLYSIGSFLFSYHIESGFQILSLHLRSQLIWLEFKDWQKVCMDVQAYTLLRCLHTPQKPFLFWKLTCYFNICCFKCASIFTCGFKSHGFWLAIIWGMASDTHGFWNSKWRTKSLAAMQGILVDIAFKEMDQPQ